MTLANGKKILMIPGPTTVPDEVLQAMHRPAIDIRTGELVEMTDRSLADLKSVFDTTGDTFIYAANGHGAWEAALSNTLSRGDTVLVLDSGAFARGWGEMAEMLGLNVEILQGDWRNAVDANALETRLKQDAGQAIKAILTVQIDTASGVINDIPALRAAINAAGHPALFMVDTIASLACVPFRMDPWGVDLALSGSQKGLMTPPGLSFIAAGARAMAAHRTANLRTHYWDWTFRQGEAHYKKYCGTPPVQMIFAFRKALDMLLEEGLTGAHRRHRLLAEAVRACVGVWAKAGALEFNILDPDARANSVTVVLTPGRDPALLRRFCLDTCGLTIGETIGEITGTGFRIGHMGHVNAPAVLGALGVIEMGLSALSIPHGAGGLQAATDHLANALRANAAETDNAQVAAAQ
ncbi:alanine--glyoxylate aminotransferase family protein [Stappia sp. ES.058]|uniref:pyridoxal-phosphate-dependent aminotransferase family protein n=1 Tax=Stappia sp. ES.058 TaxID=1881061 RepID=UPI00087B5BB2|nr:aminotransferase class V-fold PLP-dependent enzyme [Stappia sp. ES.058]SDU43946.1 alanine-glyoxylate transaminase / serine-glyoxylate transaminase / serine-pyruvate transaminase [Stappia sp. ES.058]